MFENYEDMTMTAAILCPEVCMYHSLIDVINKADVYHLQIGSPLINMESETEGRM